MNCNDAVCWYTSRYEGLSILGSHLSLVLLISRHLWQCQYSTRRGTHAYPATKKQHESLFLLSPLPHLRPICVPSSYIGVSNLAGALLRDTGLSQLDSIIISHYTHPSSTSASQTDNPPIKPNDCHMRGVIDSHRTQTHELFIRKQLRCHVQI
jgi:hypothetical protein